MATLLNGVMTAVKTLVKRVDSAKSSGADLRIAGLVRDNTREIE